MQQAKQLSEPARSNKPLPMSMRVANAMHKIGVVGLPRNYEVFYGAISGTNPELQKELMEIGRLVKCLSGPGKGFALVDFGWIPDLPIHRLPPEKLTDLC